MKRALAVGRPVISVNTKMKELMGNYGNAGQQWLPKRQPRQVQGHDFPNPSVPRAYPCGIYDLGRNAGFVNVGTDHDTGAFAMASIQGWWRLEGRQLYPYPAAGTFLITVDGGGSSGSRLRLWKLELQGLADETGLALSMCHFPLGTSKWSKLEHRLFSFISSNWRGERPHAIATDQILLPHGPVLSSGHRPPPVRPHDHATDLAAVPDQRSQMAGLGIGPRFGRPLSSRLCNWR